MRLEVKEASFSIVSFKQFLWAIFQSQSEMYYDLSSFFNNLLDSFEHLGYI